VLPGTGGLTRLVDKRKIRRDRADVFSTLAEGLKGKRAKEWGLIDDAFPTSKFQEAIDARVQAIVKSNGGSSEQVGIKLSPLKIESTDNTRDYNHVSIRLHRDKRYADLTVRAPEFDLPTTPDEIQKLGDAYWALRTFRELDDALLHLRVNEPEIGLVCVRTEGRIENVLAVDKTLAANRDHWLVREITLFMARVLPNQGKPMKRSRAKADLMLEQPKNLALSPSYPMISIGKTKFVWRSRSARRCRPMR